MKRLILRVALWGGSMLAVSAPASAHHSFAMFDQTRTTTFKDAIVMQVQWANPHVYILIKKDNATYTLECSSPSGMRESGWKFNSLKVGDKVNLAFFPLRDGRRGGALKSVVLPSGQTLTAW